MSPARSRGYPGAGSPSGAMTGVSEPRGPCGAIGTDFHRSAKPACREYERARHDWPERLRPDNSVMSMKDLSSSPQVRLRPEASEAGAAGFEPAITGPKPDA